MRGVHGGVLRRVDDWRENDAGADLSGMRRSHAVWTKVGSALQSFASRRTTTETTTGPLPGKRTGRDVEQVSPDARSRLELDQARLEMSYNITCAMFPTRTPPVMTSAAVKAIALGAALLIG